MEDVHKRWAHRYVTPKAQVRKSFVSGKGLHCVSKIKKGEVIGILGGIVIPTKDIE